MLALVELLYLSLKQTHESHNLTAEAIQVKMAATGLVTGAPFDVEVMAVNVGAQLVGKSISNADAFEMHFASDEKNYLKAMTDLRQILVARFSEEEVV